MRTEEPRTAIRIRYPRLGNRRAAAAATPTAQLLSATEGHADDESLAVPWCHSVPSQRLAVGNDPRR